MFTLTSIILAFIAGGLGTLIGGTQTFIITGFVGIITVVLDLCGIDITFMNDVCLNTLFLPCIIFNGAGFATAYASKHHKIRGVETGRSLAFTNDPLVVLAGSFAGVLGYSIYAVANYIGIPMDTGALSVIIVGVLGRCLFNQENTYNRINLEHLKSVPVKEWLFQGIQALCVCGAMAYFAYETQLYTIGFSISALSLIFTLSDSSFPATHHMTLVTGYAVMTSNSIVIGILFGLLSQVIFYIFNLIFNIDCGTHIDPPAVSIGICSLMIFCLF